MEITNQYYVVAKEAYFLIINKSISVSEAWETAAQKNIKSFASQKKGCPRATFIGLCESGTLKGVVASKESTSKNYEYAKFAIQQWKKNNNISKKEMWLMVQHKFNKAVSQQSQLDVVLGLWPFVK